MTTDEAMCRLAAGEWGFIDAGASTGGSIHYCTKRFKRGAGIGFDIRALKVQESTESGFDVCQCDLQTQSFPTDCVSFASMMDFLEHLPNMQVAEDIILNLAVPARDFLFIRHPNFDNVDYLASLGLRLTWSDWKGHTNMAHSNEFRKVFERHNWDYATLPGKQILDSTNQFVVPLEAPPDTVRYDPELHGPKPRLYFDRFIFSFCDIFVRLNKEMTDAEWFDVIRFGSCHRVDLARHHGNG